MHDADIIIKTDYILTMDRDLAVIERGAIAVKDGIITAAGSQEEIAEHYSAREIIEKEGSIAFPGLVNTHTHSPMVYFRGLADDMPLKEWLEKHIWPAEEKWLSPEFVTDAAGLACLEMVKSGITLFNDMYFYGDEIAAVARRMGIRAVVGAGIVDFPTKTAASADEHLLNAGSFIEKWKGDDFIVPCIAPHSAYACGPDTLKKAKRISEKFDVPVHTHISETQWEVGEVMARHKKRPVEHLDSLDFLDESVLAAHCIWVDDREIELLAERKVNVSHCIESNLKLASGFAPLPEMLRRGIKLSLGTDGAASNNDLNILSEMSTAAKVHKAVSNDPALVDARTVLLMATRWGAESLGMGDITGSIEEGKSADIVVADLKKPHLLPLYDVFSHLVYSMNAADIETVIIRGRVVMRDRTMNAIDEAGLMGKALEWGEKILAYKRGQAVTR